MSDVYVLIEHFNGQVSDISYVALAQAGEIAESLGGKVIALLLGNDVSSLSGELKASEVWTFENELLAEYSPDAYLNVISDILASQKPGVVLVGDTSIGAELSGLLSIKMEIPLISACQSVHDDGGLKYTCQICGGKIMTEGAVPDETTLIAMIPGAYKVEDGKGAAGTIISKDCPDLSALKTTFIQYIEPDDEDIDISTVPVLIGVGRGIENEDNMEVAEELADMLGGHLCASRPVIDQNWLPTTRLVGKSGKTIAPKVYIAMGISGAPEHSEAVLGSDLIIAVNTDENAPIFNLAQYGILEDLVDFTEALSEKIEEAKGG